MLSDIRMRRGHFLKDLKTFGQSGLLKYVQGTMAEFKAKMDLFRDDPVLSGVCCNDLLSIFFIFYLNSPSLFF